MSNYQKVKVIVAGDSGVGKTAFVNLLCYNKVLTNPNWTIGAQVEIKLHDYNAGTPTQTNYCVELWDIGGYKNHTNSRSVFYSNTDGIILVYDVTNKKSENNLDEWVNEIVKCNPESRQDRYRDDSSVLGSYLGDSFGTFSTNSDWFQRVITTPQMPVLVVGTNIDQIRVSKAPEIKCKHTLISLIIKWNENYGQSFPHIKFCLNYLRFKFKKDVKNTEKILNRTKHEIRHINMLEEEEKQRNYQHLISVFKDNKVMITTSLTTIKSCYNLLVNDLTEDVNNEEDIPNVSNIENVLFPGVHEETGTVDIEFCGPSVKLPSSMNDVCVDLSEENMCIKLNENRDNEDLIRTLKEEISTIQRTYVPLLNNIIKKLKALGKTKKDLEPISNLSWTVLECLKRYEKIKIINNDSSFNLVSSDSEQDDSDFIDVP